MPVRRTAAKRGSASTKSRILKKIAKELKKLHHGPRGIDQYAKNPTYDKGGVYGKGDFLKSDPAKKGKSKPWKSKAKSKAKRARAKR
jgi:hypothetical protein